MKHFLLFIVAAVALSAGAQEVICHRGYWDVEGSAQNSIRSLVKADSIGAWGSEFDVWMTADGVLVVNHDESYGGVVIETAKWKDLKDMRLANGEKLPTLKEMLNCGKKLKTRLILELKPHTDKQHEAEAARRAVKMVRKLKLTDRVEYITFSYQAVKVLKTLVNPYFCISFYRICQMFTGVQCVFQVFVDIFPLDDLDRIALFPEQLPKGSSENSITQILHPVDFNDCFVRLIVFLVVRKHFEQNLHF